MADMRHKLYFISLFNCCLSIVEHEWIKTNKSPFYDIFLTIIFILDEIIFKIFNYGQTSKIAYIIINLRVPYSFEYAKCDTSGHASQEVDKRFTQIIKFFEQVNAHLYTNLKRTGIEVTCNDLFLTLLKDLMLLDYYMALFSTYSFVKVNETVITLLNKLWIIIILIN